MPTRSVSTSQQMRDRAHALRGLARLLDDAAALDLHRRAGTDVWVGPTPQRCADDLRRARTALLGAIDDLRSAARSLDQRALQADLVPVQ